MSGESQRNEENVPHIFWSVLTAMHSHGQNIENDFDLF